MQKVLILMLTYNNANCVEDALKDWLHQTHQNFDIYVFDDASTDKTVEIVKHLSSPKVHLIQRENNLGVCRNFHGALIRLKSKIQASDFFVWACPDDRYEKVYLQKCLEQMQNDPKQVAVHSNVTVVGQNTFAMVYQPIHQKNLLEVQWLFKDINPQDNRPRAYNQFLHGVWRAKIVLSIYSLRFSVIRAVLTCELFMVGFLLCFGNVGVVPLFLNTKNIDAPLDKRYPNEEFCLWRKKRLSYLKSFFLVALYHAKHFFITPKLFCFILHKTFRHYIGIPLKIFIYENVLRKIKR